MAATIFVADPDLDIREIYQFQFRKAGFRTEVVESGEAILAQVKQARHDILITAINLGAGIDG